LKKLMSLLLLGFALIFSQTVDAMTSTSYVYVHYYRFAEDYTNWSAWIWQNQPENQPGVAYQFSPDDTSSEHNFGGVLAKIPISGDLAEATRLGIIIRLGDWLAKDVEIDRFIDVPSQSENGIHHVYLVEGDVRIGTSLNDPQGPDRSPKLTFSYFNAMDAVEFRSTEPVNQNQVRVLADDIPVAIVDYSQNNLIGQIKLADDLDFSKDYELEVTFSDGGTRRFSLTFDGIYDTPEFEEAFGYDGALGALWQSSKTTFKLWAPVSQAVTLNLYDTGTPAHNGGTDDPVERLVMQPGPQGTFEVSVEGDLHGVYYTFSVTNGDMTHEVIDPYAFAAGINGVRGMVVDFSRLNPNGWVYGARPDMHQPTDAVIYELQVRDLTSHESWQGSEENRARFLGLVEQGTTYDGVSTGFDHIVELGVTHVQLLPFFDFGYIDESRVGEEGYNAFNWGYMPINFNVLEGSFSADPFDGNRRIEEFKHVVMGFHEADIRIIMDVVYNHTGLTADSNFNLIVPGYYFRKNPDGSFSNGSGTGNETASERVMMRKFIIDSLVFWAEEYNISGFRFDLMALHDVETMNLAAEALHAIDPTILIFGEPWMGGSSPLPESEQAGKRNLFKMPTIGAFNDDFRDAVKGSVFASQEGGFVQGNFNLRNRVIYGLIGGVSHPQHGYNAWHLEPYKTINYVTAHDNNTLHDKLYITLEEQNRLPLLDRMFRQSNVMVLTAQGIPFIHAGDEFLRSKPDDGLTQRQYARFGFVHNSYESTDTVNQMRWDLKASEQGLAMNAFFQGLIELRKTSDLLRLPNSESIIEALHLPEQTLEGVIHYEIRDESEPWNRLLIVHNSNDSTVRMTLPREGGWVTVVNGQTAGTTPLAEHLGGSQLRIPAHTSLVLYQDTQIGDISFNPIPYILSFTILIVGLGFNVVLTKRLVS